VKHGAQEQPTGSEGAWKWAFGSIRAPPVQRHRHGAPASCRGADTSHESVSIAYQGRSSQPRSPTALLGWHVSGGRCVCECCGRGASPHRTCSGTARHPCARSCAEHEEKAAAGVDRMRDSTSGGHVLCLQHFMVSSGCQLPAALSPHVELRYSRYALGAERFGGASQRSASPMDCIRDHRLCEPRGWWVVLGEAG